MHVTLKRRMILFLPKKRERDKYEIATPHLGLSVLFFISFFFFTCNYYIEMMAVVDYVLVGRSLSIFTYIALLYVHCFKVSYGTYLRWTTHKTKGKAGKRKMRKMSVSKMKIRSIDMRI